MESTRVRVAQPRCPFCHDEVAPGAAQTPCLACRAWHHAPCWDEATGCAACGAGRAARPVVLARARPARDARGGSGWPAALWVGVVATFLFVEVTVLPAFARMFREVGVNLPRATEWVLGPERWVLGLSILSLLYCAQVARTRAWRDGALQAGVLGLIGGTLGFVWALFLPLTEMNQRL